MKNSKQQCSRLGLLAEWKDIRISRENDLLILENSRIFGVNLYGAGLAEKVLGYFCEMMEGPGAVRKTLEKYILMSEKGGEF